YCRGCFRSAKPVTCVTSAATPGMSEPTLTSGSAQSYGRVYIRHPHEQLASLTETCSGLRAGIPPAGRAVPWPVDRRLHASNPSRRGVLAISVQAIPIRPAAQGSVTTLRQALLLAAHIAH